MNYEVKIVAICVRISVRCQHDLYVYIYRCYLPILSSPLMAMKKEAFSYNALAFIEVQRSSQNSWLRSIDSILPF